MIPPSRLVVLISGSGTNLQAILDACKGGGLNAHVVAVVSNKADAYGLERARGAGVPAIYKPKPKDQDRSSYDSDLAKLVASYQPDWVVLAGWMRVLSRAFLERFQGRVINLRPALPGTFPGAHAIERAHQAFGRGEITRTGIMVHLVPDEDVDVGPVLAQQVVPVFPGESLESLEERIHNAERHLLVATLKNLVQNL